MVTVSDRLIHRHLDTPLLREGYSFISNDLEIQSYLRMSNVMAVKRMNFNDHGPVHSKIVSGSALEIFNLITDVVEPSSVLNGVGCHDDARLVVLLGAYLHDIGNAVHRVDHERVGVLLSSSFLDRLLFHLYPDDMDIAYLLKCEVLHSIFSSDDSVSCLSVEAGIVTVADGTDMASGRSRIPYMQGKTDIHAVSAQAIERVDVSAGDEKPVLIHVSMENPAGIFQVEEVIGRKMLSSGIAEQFEVIATMNGKKIKTLC